MTWWERFITWWNAPIGPPQWHDECSDLQQGRDFCTHGINAHGPDYGK